MAFGLQIGKMEIMTKTIRAHFDGQFIVPDEPIDLPFNQPLTVRVDVSPRVSADKPPRWTSLNLPVDDELARAIAEEPEFDISES